MCFSRLIWIRDVQAANLEMSAHLVNDVQREVQVSYECECAVAEQEVIFVEQRAVE